MTRLEWIGRTTRRICAILATAVTIGNGPAVSHADDPAAANAAAPQQKTGKQKAAAARAARQAKRLMAQRRAQAEEQAYNAGFGSGSSASSGASSMLSWNSGLGSLNGFGSGNLSGIGSTGSSGNTSGSSSRNTTGTGANGGSGPTGDGSTVSPTYNAKIHEFAVDHLGMQVGNGECWTLAADALIYAGAKPAEGYVFGDKIPMSGIQAGDILQFENALFVGTTYWLRLGFPHHTAIVDTVQGTTVVILHQNYNNSRVVRMTTLDFADFKGGTVTAYRAVAPDLSDPTAGGSSPATTASPPGTGRCKTDSGSTQRAATPGM